MFSAIGTLLYNPERTGLKKTDQINTLIVDLPLENIAEYYQWFLKKQYGEKFKLQSPMFGTHVTVIRPQEVNIQHPAWLKYQNQSIEVFYFPEHLERHWEFWSLTVFSKELIEIRKEFGLRTDFRLHMTIGRQFDWQHRPLLKNVVHDSDYHELHFEC